MLKYLIKNPIHLRLEQRTPIYSPIKLKSNTSCRTCNIKKIRGRLKEISYKKDKGMWTPTTNQSGITLIELLTYVSITGFLTRIRFSQYRQLKGTRLRASMPKQVFSIYFVHAKFIWRDNNVTTSPCNITAVSRAPYSFAFSTNITIPGTGTEPSFSKTASHSFSTNTLTINAAVF